MNPSNAQNRDLLIQSIEIPEFGVTVEVQFQQKLGYIPFLGTLNVIDDIRRYNFCLELLHIFLVGLCNYISECLNFLSQKEIVLHTVSRKWSVFISGSSVFP